MREECEGRVVTQKKGQCNEQDHQTTPNPRASASWKQSEYPTHPGKARKGNEETQPGSASTQPRGGTAG